MWLVAYLVLSIWVKFSNPTGGKCSRMWLKLSLNILTLQCSSILCRNRSSLWWKEIQMIESFCYIYPKELDRLQVGFIWSYPPPPPCPTQALVMFSWSCPRLPWGFTHAWAGGHGEDRQPGKPEHHLLRSLNPSYRLSAPGALLK